MIRLTSSRFIFRKLPHRRWLTTTPTTTADNPLEAIHQATASLQDASTRLQSIHDFIQAQHTIDGDSSSDREVTLRDIVLHSRDSKPGEFQEPLAQAARKALLPHAETVEQELQTLRSFYMDNVLPQMELAVKICQETPCGGASWEVDLVADSEIRVEQKDTPCGRLHTANMSFLQVTFDTKEDVILGSRAALILRLAQELNEPLATVRVGNDGARKQRIGQVFAEQVVPTPWLRSNEEYEQFFKLKEQFEGQA